jgi:hypothetical protein
VLLENGRVDVFEYVAATHGGDINGIDEYVSTDGGSSFSLQPDAVSYVPGGDGTAGPIVALPDDGFGAGYVAAGSNPAFQANSLTSPSNDSQATAPASATLNPSPPTAYTIGNLGGQFAAQLTGSPGVLGVLAANTGKGSSPCPSSAEAALVYAYAPISSSTTAAQLNTSVGDSGSPWHALAEVDCDGVDPAVGGGPSGLGLLETSVAASPSGVIEYRAFSPASGFAAPVKVAVGEQDLDATLSQDGAGGIYATWLDGGTGVDLAYSSDGGASFSAPKTLLSDSGDPGAIATLASAVDASGNGWAVYEANGKEYAQQFSKADV